MRLHTTLAVAVIFLTLFGSAAAQQVVDDSKISQVRTTVQSLQHLSDDASLAAEARKNFSELLFEKRAELHGLLRQKRDSLRNQLTSATSPSDQARINEELNRISSEMQQLSASAPMPTSVTTPAESQPETAETTATAPSTNDAPSSPAPTAPQNPPVEPQGECAQLLNAPASRTFNYRDEIRAAACRMELAKANKVGPAEERLNILAYTSVIALGLIEPEMRRVGVSELTAQAENASNSKNVSAVASSSGSTALVSKAGIPAIFGFAVENGALTRTESGTAVTFTGNPVGLVQALAKKGFITSFQEQDELTGFLRKLSFGLTFDTSRGNQPGTFTGDKQQLSGFQFKYNIIDQRDPRQQRYTDQWESITRNQAARLARAYNNFVRASSSNQALKDWLENTNRRLANETGFARIESILAEELAKLPEIELPEDVKAMVREVGTNFDAFLTRRNEILDEISNGWIATIEYNNERPPGSPSLSNLRFLIEKGAYNGSIDLTGNASVTFYNSRPTDPSIKRLRDFRFAGQLDVPMGDVTKTGKFMLSFAGRYQRLLEDEPIEGTDVVIRKGDIAVGQVKLTIPIRGTALKFPISLSFANRTELIQEKEIRGNFGVTFDLDSIFAKINPFGRP